MVGRIVGAKKRDCLFINTNTNVNVINGFIAACFSLFSCSSR